MKKLLFSVVALVCFSLSSFAGDNPVKAEHLVQNSKSLNVIEKDGDCDITIEIKWITCDGPKNDPRSYTIHIKRMVISADC